jgi:lipoprotein-anchoring transpeptidase ErfK/SrfK
MRPSLLRRSARPFVLAAVSLALLLGAAACSDGAKTVSVDTTVKETTTSTAVAAHTTQVAAAKGTTITVLTSLPKGVTTTLPATPSSTTSTTAPAAAALPPIPRTDLNSAGVKKVADGYEYSNPTYFSNPLVFDVVENQGDWLKVLIPARPNHTEGWVKASDVTLSDTDYRMELDLSTFHLKVFKGNDLFVETDVVIGKDATKTPTGHFYLLEKIKQPNDTGVYGPWVLATNGYSEMLDQFDGGLPVIAFHGTNQPDLIGTKASNGCIRMPNDVVTKLAETLPAGTPIDILPVTPAAATPSPL